MRKRTQRDPFYPRAGHRPERRERHAAAGLELGAAPDLGDGRPQLVLVHVVQQQPRSPGGERLVDLLGVADLDLERAGELRARRAPRSIASAIPPAAAMWFSLIRIASYSPAR